MLRRIPPAWFPDAGNPGGPPIISFIPRAPNPERKDPGDHDGLSVTCESCRSPAQVAVSGDPSKRYLVAAFEAGCLRGLRRAEQEECLDVVLQEIETDDGHSLIPQLTGEGHTTKEGKLRLKEWAYLIALKCASMCNTTAA